MTDTERSECPECGGELVKGRSTQKFGYLSCTDCEWYEEVDDGKYATDGGPDSTDIERVQIITETRRAMRIYKCNVCENEFVVVNSGHKDPEACPWRSLHTEADQ